MEIRIAHKDDTAALIEFNLAMALETEGKQLDREILRSGVEAVFADKQKGFYLVAEDAGKIVGGLMVTYEWSDWRNSWFWWIQSVYIVPEARGKGLYSRMYEQIKKMAEEKNDVCGFRLYVEAENTTARTVYLKLGMEQSHYLMFEQQI